MLRLGEAITKRNAVKAPGDAYEKSPIFLLILEGLMTKFGEEEGLAHVEIGDKVGYINQAGEIVIKPQFDGAGSFSK